MSICLVCLILSFQVLSLHENKNRNVTVAMGDILIMSNEMVSYLSHCLRSSEIHGHIKITSLQFFKITHNVGHDVEIDHYTYTILGIYSAV